MSSIVYYRSRLVLISLPVGGHVHEEIFTFPRLVGDQRGLEWELLVLPVIELWGRYVRELV